MTQVRSWYIYINEFLHVRMALDNIHNWSFNYCTKIVAKYVYKLLVRDIIYIYDNDNM